MKIKFSLLLAVIIILGTFVSAFAAEVEGIKATLQKDSIETAKENLDVKKAVDKSVVKEIFLKNKDKFRIQGLENVSSTDELAYGTPYKVTLANKELVNTLLSGKKLSGILQSLPYYWEVPIVLKSNPEVPVGSFTVAYFKGGWNVAEIGGYLPGQDISLSENNEKIANTLKENGIEKANSFGHVRIPSLRTDYLYIDTADQELFIPLSKSKPVGKKIKQTKAELMSEVGDTLKKGLDVKELSIGGSGKDTTAAQSGSEGSKRLAPLAIAVAAAASALVMWKKFFNRQTVEG
ncbi:MAG: hypothetical protein N2645_04380 [Clostridia bacterium]|nr:hypothetical protein [Clostridia bacterium]